MTIQESINRSVNLLGTSINALAAFAFAPEMFVEQDPPDKIDDVLVFLIGLVAMWWYWKGGNSYKRSIAPVVFILLATVVKIAGLLIELDDPEAMGDDAGGVILFILASGLVIYQYLKAKKLLLAQAQ